MTPEELAAYRSELLDAKALVAELKWQLALRCFARKYNPDQPRVPAGNPDGGQWTSEGGAEFQFVRAGMPKIPRERPPDSRDRTAIAVAVANWIAEKGVLAAEAIAKTSWLYHAIPTITSYLDAPKSLEELQEDASTPKAGYDRHHIIEQTSAAEDGYPRNRSMQRIIVFESLG
jgi:hypothetical protein